MRVFLTGVSGFIGSHVARTLLSKGCQVLALMRPDTSLGRLQDVVDQLTIFRGSLADVSPLRHVLEEWRPNACIHLAWYAEPGQYLTSPENIASLVGTLSLLESLIQAGCAQVVMAGTCAEYDFNQGLLREDGRTRPITLYAATKLAMNLIGQRIAEAAHIKFSWARLFYLYGPFEDERRAVPALIRALLKGEDFPATLGEQVRDYLHVEDVAGAFWTLADQDGSGVFNVSSGEPVTVRQVFETVGAKIGRTELIHFGELPYREWEPMFICGDNSRLKGLGWSQKYSLETGLRQAIDWWKCRI